MPTLLPFDMANHLRSEADIAAYLTLVLEDGDIEELTAALGHIARARGMTKLAEDTGLSRESLYKGFSGKRIPSSATLLKVVKSLGFQIAIVPASSSATSIIPIKNLSTEVDAHQPSK